MQDLNSVSKLSRTRAEKGWADLAKRKTTITVETHSLTILRTQGCSACLWCANCGAESQMITVEQAAGVCSVTQRAVFGLVEDARVHFTETPAGRLLICAESLRQLAESSARDI